MCWTSSTLPVAEFSAGACNWSGATCKWYSCQFGSPRGSFRQVLTDSRVYQNNTIAATITMNAGTGNDAIRQQCAVQCM